MFSAPLRLSQIILLLKKFSVFYTYVYRSLNIFPDSSFLRRELNYLKSVAIKRSFSPSIINQAIKKFTKPPHNSTLSNDVKSKSYNSVVLSFYPPLCFKLAKILKWFNFKVIFKLINKFLLN